MSTHVVYKFLHPETKDVIYVGSGTHSRPASSLRNSHIEGIRKIKDSLEVKISKAMTEENARNLEARLIQKYKPEFNTAVPRISFPRIVNKSFSGAALILPIGTGETKILNLALSAIGESPVLADDRYLVWADYSSKSFMIHDVNCRKPIKFSIADGYLEIKVTYENLHVDYVEKEDRSVLDLAKLPLCILDIFLNEVLLEPPEMYLRSEYVEIYSLDLVSYQKFNYSIKENFHLLAYLSQSKLNVSGDSFPIADFIGVQARCFREMADQDYSGFTNSSCQGAFNKVSIRKKMNNAVACSQTLGIHSDNVIKTESFLNRAYLAAWLKAIDISFNSTLSITIKFVTAIYENSSFISSITQQMNNELGLRTLLLAPTLEQISFLVENEKSPLGARDRKTLDEWMKSSKATIEISNKNSKRIVWESILDAGAHKNRELFKVLLSNHYLDLRLPITFYGFLNEVRGEFFLTMRDREALADERIGYTGGASLAAEAPRIRLEVQEKVKQSILGLKKTLNLPGPESKKSIAMKYQPKDKG